MVVFTTPSPPKDVLSLLTPQAIKAPDHVLGLLRRLHQDSLDQETALKESEEVKNIRTNEDIEPAERKKMFDDLMRDKFIALVPDKALYVYNLIRATGALNVVEAGTSYGVSTIYLALAVGQNAAIQGKRSGEAAVIATEMEPTKAQKARQYWEEAGDAVKQWIDLREGDLTQTLQHGVSQIDFVLFDIWAPMVMPTLRLLEPKLRPGAVLLTDNSISSAAGYAEFLEYIRAPDSPYTTMTLPFEDGLELTVYSP